MRSGVYNAHKISLVFAGFILDKKRGFEIELIRGAPIQVGGGQFFSALLKTSQGCVRKI